MTTPYERGKRMERQAVEDLEALGYGAQRTAGSHGPFDVIAWDESMVMLIQVKRSDESPYFAQLIEEARIAWEDLPIPEDPHILRYLWIRYGGTWHKFRLE